MLNLFISTSVFLSILVLLFVPEQIYAKDFFVSTEAIYTIGDPDSTNVLYKIAITNAKTELHAESFELRLVDVYPNNVVAQENGKNIPVKLVREDDTSLISVSFTESIVGEGKTRDFEISFTDPTLTKREGSLMEVSVPRLDNPEDFESYTVKLASPEVLGNAAFINPAPNTQVLRNGYYYYYFTQAQLVDSGVTAAFGNFQVYDFHLKYHLENPLQQSSSVTIALPPDTTYQTVYYKQIEPRPTEIVLDEDLNWLARYSLTARQKIDVLAEGSVQVFADPQHPESLDNWQTYLSPLEYWQADNPGIMDIARRHSTPESIYKYVVQTLSYSKQNVLPNAKRLGAVGALVSPNSAICMEFTDLFIAIARAAGIPAREVNGYAYSDNPDLEPLSLVSDVLHSWPEYWDETRKMWVQVDPTWGDTSGTDYFNKLDMRHVTFVKHGVSSKEPYPPGSYKLGAFPQKDVYVEPSSLPLDRDESYKIVFSPVSYLPFHSIEQKVEIFNTSSSAVYDVSVNVNYEDKHVYTHKLHIIPPFSSSEITLKLPIGFLGNSIPASVTVGVGERSETVDLNKQNYVITMVVIALVPIVAASLAVALVLKRRK
ncbi:hypothetical protein C4564_06010 [Candidatus Microgenomates bacterium]|nr:MAG: hypothetical protein C4564_06010 [Candidatus Microgenomates bacterium]